jgi:hypothetical protein
MQRNRKALLAWEAQQASVAKARQAAREEFVNRQREAMRNKAAAEGQLGRAAAHRYPAPAAHAVLDAEVARRRAHAGNHGTHTAEPHDNVG